MSGLLAFPVKDFFWEKVFEIWCLKEVVQALEQLGFAGGNLLNPLSQRKGGPLAEMSNGGDTYVWFQKQEPMGTARWRYADTEAGFRGIPDIVISCERAGTLVVDAKFRFSGTGERSAEIYKMLGYADNFRDTFEGGNGFRGLLVFVGDDVERRTLITDVNDQLDMVSVTPDCGGRAQYQDLFGNVVEEWLSG